MPHSEQSVLALLPLMALLRDGKMRRAFPDKCQSWCRLAESACCV